MLRIDIEDAQVIERTKRDNSGVYHQQVGYAYTHDQNGPNRHPEKIFIFVNKDRSTGQPKPLPVGKYVLSPSSLRVRNGQLEVGFLNLEPVKS